MENREPLLHCWINHQGLVPYSRTQLLPVKVKNFILWVFSREKSGIPQMNNPRRRNAEELEALQNPIRARLSHSHQFLLFLDRYLFHNLGVAKSYLPPFSNTLLILQFLCMTDVMRLCGGMGEFSAAKRMFWVWMITEIILMQVWLQSMVHLSEGFQSSFNHVRFKKFKFKKYVLSIIFVNHSSSLFTFFFLW